MSFNVLYIEDTKNDADDLQSAVEEVNASRGSEILSLIPMEKPDSLYEALNSDVDLVLADVYFDKVDRLDDIIRDVSNWNRRSSTKPIPIIAYTSWSVAALRSCLERGNHYTISGIRIRLSLPMRLGGCQSWLVIYHRCDLIPCYRARSVA